MKRAFKIRAQDIIKHYIEGSDLTEEEEHTLHDCANEHGQLLDNVIGAAWFTHALALNLQALEI